MAQATYLKDINVYDEISHQDVRKAHSSKVCRNLEKGEVISEPDECEGKVFIVESGQVRLYKLSIDGREQTLDILSSGAIFGDIVFEKGEKADCAFAAAEDKKACVCIISKEDFLNLLKDKPSLAIKIISDLASRLKTAQQKIANLSLSDAKMRLLSELVRLGKSFGTESANKITIKRRFTHEQLANLIGTTRETVTKTLKAINWLVLIPTFSYPVVTASTAWLPMPILFMPDAAVLPALSPAKKLVTSELPSEKRMPLSSKPARTLLLLSWMSTILAVWPLNASTISI